jgi:hypothetical protein
MEAKGGGKGNFWVGEDRGKLQGAWDSKVLAGSEQQNFEPECTVIFVFGLLCPLYFSGFSISFTML